MHRRAFISLAAVVPIAGCSGLLGGGVDATIEDEEPVEFDADEGSELTVSVEVQEIAELDTDADHERESVTLQINHEDAGIVDTWSIEDSKTFDLTIDDGGTHTVIIIGGVADVTIE
ncbi:hypothetical protein ACLI4Z_10305 [Natrialbaceae archaeon A-arb3/5]